MIHSKLYEPKKMLLKLYHQSFNNSDQNTVDNKKLSFLMKIFILFKKEILRRIIKFLN